MRKYNLVRSLGTAMLLAPLLTACGSDGAGGGGGGVVDGQLPVCSAGQALSTNMLGAPICKDLPNGVIVLPTCNKDTQAVTSNGSNLTCTDRNTGSDGTSQTTVNDLVSKIDSYEMQIKNKLNTGVPKNRVFIGVTANSSGQVNPTKGDSGWHAAAKVCQEAFAGKTDARMCSIEDLYHSIRTGALSPDDAAKQITGALGAWVNATGLNQFAGATPTAGFQQLGLSDNCGGHVYQTGHINWTGTAAQTVLAGGNSRFQLKLLANQACGTARPIACCATP